MRRLLDATTIPLLGTNRSKIRCSGGSTEREETRTQNIPMASHHRVGLCSWTVKGGLVQGDPRVQTLDSLFKHTDACGYDGVEISFVQFKGLYLKRQMELSEADGTAADDSFAAEIRAAAAKHGVSVLGATYHIMDGAAAEAGAPDFSDPDLHCKLSRRMKLDKSLGSEYVNFQIFLPPEYMHTPLAWRDDDDYLARTVDRAIFLRDLCWSHGLNAYFETHIDRWGEDPVFFRKVLESSRSRGGLEANGDLSHYLYRGFINGKDVAAVLEAVNHLHVRMARMHGDLSIETLDPARDFADGGPTRQQWDMILRTGPLSSRTICGEAGPFNLVTKTLDQDARMVPMLKALAAVKDGSTVHLSPDFNPFGKPMRVRL